MEDSINIEEIFEKAKIINEKKNFNNSYIISSLIINLIVKCEFNINNKAISKKSKKIYVYNKDIFFTSYSNIIIGNINDKLFIPKYILSFFDFKILALELNNLLINSLEEYIKLRNCHINNDYSQNLIDNNSNIGEFIILNKSKDNKNILKTHNNPKGNNIDKKYKKDIFNINKNNIKKINKRAISCKNNNKNRLNQNNPSLSNSFKINSANYSNKIEINNEKKNLDYSKIIKKELDSMKGIDKLINNSNISMMNTKKVPMINISSFGMENIKIFQININDQPTKIKNQIDINSNDDTKENYMKHKNELDMNNRELQIVKEEKDQYKNERNEIDNFNESYKAIKNELEKAKIALKKEIKEKELFKTNNLNLQEKIHQKETENEKNIKQYNDIIKDKENQIKNLIGKNKEIEEENIGLKQKLNSLLEKENIILKEKENQLKELETNYLNEKKELKNLKAKLNIIQRELKDKKEELINVQLKNNNLIMEKIKKKSKLRI